MNLRCKKPRPLTREEKTYRDDRLFVIATEDTYAPEQYFRNFESTRIHVLVLPSEGGHSSPEHVLRRLDEFRREWETMEEDELWLMLDTDHWVEPNHVANFTQVCTEALQKGFQLAHSNPCFETWLLLHVADVAPTEQYGRCEDVLKHLREILGGYGKGSLDPRRFNRETAAEAVVRAKRLDEAPDARWPQKTGSHVYRVVERLL